MIRNHRYRGVYIHGRIKRVRRGGKRVAVQAAPEEIIVSMSPSGASSMTATGSRPRKASERSRSIARSLGRDTLRVQRHRAMREVKGSIGAKNSRMTNGTHEKVYACNWHHERGSAVCPITLRQAIGDVEWSVADYLVSNDPHRARDQTDHV